MLFAEILQIGVGCYAFHQLQLECRGVNSMPNTINLNTAFLPLLATTKNRSEGFLQLHIDGSWSFSSTGFRVWLLWFFTMVVMLGIQL